MINFLYIVLGVVGIIIILQLFMRLKSWRQTGKPAPLVSGKLGQKINAAENVIAYFFSPSCGACKVQEKHLNGVEKQFKNVVRINAGKEQETAKKFNVMGLPTTVVIKNGMITNYFVGVTPEAKLLTAVN